ncbi:TPA: hypothetical protein N0F65_002359 [Lagenidium giganteum]|uniref:Calmodulin n=1 Tax=Lagenidium giganteum TaxID=4803 RepID=A0AAV2YPQ8_9STRA|nr:TPA: hypothetical protein N0F65_002359 [Lagenidium giganteum]
MGIFSHSQGSTTPVQVLRQPGRVAPARGSDDRSTSASKASTVLRRVAFAGTGNRQRRKDVIEIFQTKRKVDSSHIGSSSKSAAAELQPTVTSLLDPARVDRLQRLFQLCDGNDDDRLTPSECDLLFGILGLRAKQFNRMLSYTGGMSALSTPGRKDRATTLGFRFDQFLAKYGRLVDEFAQMPADDFLARCKRMKIGFQRCDTNADSAITFIEFEIAIQKLGVIATDDDLLAAFDRLDHNRDGFVEWSDLVGDLWKTTLPHQRSQTQGFLIGRMPLDVLGDLPSTLLPTQVCDRPATSRDSQRERVVSHTQQIKMLQHRNPTVRIAGWRLPSAMRRLTMPGEGKWSIELVAVKIVVSIAQKRVNLIKSSRNSKKSTVRPFAPEIRHNATAGTAGGIATGFSAKVRHQVRRIEFVAIVLGALSGVLCGMLSSACEDAAFGSAEEKAKVSDVTYYGYLILINTGVSLIEVTSMYITALACAFQVTVYTNLVLYPLDREREFLARAIARAAMQIPMRTEPLFGISPSRGVHSVSVMCNFLMYTTKRFALRFLIKLLIRRVLWRAAAKTLQIFVFLPINGILDAWTLSRVMLACRVSIIGPPCAIAALNHLFVEDRCLASPFQHVDYLRVLGCVIVSKRCIPPALELMINHMRSEWLQEGLWPRGDGCGCFDRPNDPCNVHPLDDVDRLLVSLMLYTARRRDKSSSHSAIQHLRAIFFLLIIGLIIDGSLEWSERRLYMRACRAAKMQNEWKAIVRLKNEYVEGKGIQLSAIQKIIKHEKHSSFKLERQECSDLDEAAVSHTPWRESLSFALHRLANILSV